MKYLIYLFFFISISCNQNEKINPNGDSEMSLLMRDMVISLDDIRLMIQDNKVNKKLYFDFKEIHKAEVTDSSFLFDGFNLMSKNFSSLLDSLELNVNSKNYNNLIESCLSCHVLVCPGPISKIDKMFID
tara:strand:+ start:350 stop:739 length:390 start_codon:yes stop_codon:yes gene_type:complete